MIKYIFLLTVLAGLTILNSCKKDDNNDKPTVPVPVLSTSAVSSIAATTAQCGGNITSDGGATITTRGVCWSTNQTPTLNDNKTSDGTGAGTFTSSITGLIANTTYYVRAYATNSGGTGYGSAMSFTTTQSLPTTGSIQAINNSSNPYNVYVNGALQFTQSGGTSHTITNVSPGYYTIRVLQQSGYIVYPTDETFNGNVTAGNTLIISYP